MTPRASFKARLRARDPMYGCFVGLPSPAMVEMVGYAGFDFVIIDVEHGTFSPESIEHMVRAADIANIPALVRLPSGSNYHILGALEMGAAGFMVPHVGSVAQTREIVASAYYPPLGHRGISSRTRAAQHGMVRPANYLPSQAEQTSVILMIEDKDTIPEVGAMAKVEGVDAMFVGPSDLSASLGRMANPKHPDVVGALDRIFKDVIAAKGPALATTIQTPADVADLAKAGVTMMCMNATYIFATRLQEVVGELRPAKQ